MYHAIDQTPATAHSQEGPGTGTSPQASTRSNEAEQAMVRYTGASLDYLEAVAARHRAEEAMYRALAHAHRVDPHLTSADRLLLADSTDHRAEDAAQQALVAQGRADALRKEFPYLATEASAVVVITIRRDRIDQTARLAMGATVSASRAWSRTGASSWRTVDPDWSTHEERIGLELVELMDELPMADRVAAMLPRPPAPGSNAARNAAVEVARA